MSDTFPRFETAPQGEKVSDTVSQLGAYPPLQHGCQTPGREVALDQQERELALRGGEAAAVFLELTVKRSSGAQILPLADDPADLGRQRLHGMAYCTVVAGRVHGFKVIGASYGVS